MNQLTAAYRAMGESNMAINITTTLSELIDFAKFVSESGKKEAIQVKADEDTLFTPEEVMELFKIKSKVSLWRWQKRGYLNPVYAGGQVRYRRSEVNRLLNRKSEKK